MQTVELYREFIACMRAFLHGDTYTVSLSAADWGKFYHLAKRQSLSGALHEVLSPDTMPEPVRDRLRRDAFLTMASYETQQRVIKDLTAALTASQIAHLLFKGAVTRRYYRCPTMRSMGDIDAAVHRTARDAADACLCAAGFEKQKEQPEVWVYKKDGVLLELHTVLRRYNTFTQDKEPYADVWTDARRKQGTTHHLSDEAEIAYAVAHMASHACGGGCGIRQLMDLAVLYERFPETALWERVFTRLHEIGETRFARHMLWLCSTWFGVEIPDELMLPLNADTETYWLMRMLQDGTFGTDERRMLSRMRQERLSQKGGGRSGTLARWLLPSPAYLKRQYAYAEHAMLLPVAYVHRLVDGVTKNRRIHTARLQYAKEHEADLEQELQYFKEIGLS